MNDFLPVLLYHSVPSTRSRDGFAVPRPEFEEHLDAIRASGRMPLRISQLADAIARERPFSYPAVALTFDDGFADTYDAAELLVDRSLSATIYITTGEVGVPNRLTGRQINELAQIPALEFGAHSVVHTYLDELPAGAIATEVADSKDQLAAITQLPVRSFAYPHGAYDKRVRRAVISAGYDSAVAVKNALSHPHDDVFAIARWTVTGGTPASRVADVLDGRGVPRAWRRERVRTRAYRTYRRTVAPFR